MKSNKIKMLKIFSGAILVFGVSACAPSSEKKEYTNTKDSVTEIAPKEEVAIPEETVEGKNVYETNQTFKSESELLQFIQKGTIKLNEFSQSEPVQHVKDTVIHSGIALADFILLDEPIGNMKLSQLTENGKTVVLQSIIAVDDLAKTVAPEMYPKIQNKIVEIKNKFKDIVVGIVGEENYEYFGELKDKAIEAAKKAWEKGTDYIKDGYSKIKEKNNK